MLQESLRNLFLYQYMASQLCLCSLLCQSFSCLTAVLKRPRMVCQMLLHNLASWMLLRKHLLQMWEQTMKPTECIGTNSTVHMILDTSTRMLQFRSGGRRPWRMFRLTMMYNIPASAVGPGEEAHCICS